MKGYESVDESKITRFEPNVTYVSCSPLNYHAFYRLLEVVRDESGSYVVTDKGIFNLADNYIHIRDLRTFEISYSEYFIDNKSSIIEAIDTFESLGFDKPRDDTYSMFLNAYGEFVELEI